MAQLSVETVRQLRARGWTVTFAAGEIRLRNGPHQMTLVDRARVLLEDSRQADAGIKGPLRRFDPIWRTALDLLHVDTDTAIFSPPHARWLYPTRMRVKSGGLRE